MGAAMTRHRPSKAARPPRPPLVIDAIPFALLDEPLEYIFADHARQRAVCAALQDFAETGFASRSEADIVTAFLTHDRPIHHADEEEDLFPLLRRRSVPDDNLGAALARLGEDHRRGDAIVDDIVAALSERPGRQRVTVSDAVGELMQVYAADEHRHLAIENGVVLAIAKIRLTRRDLRIMSRGMKARRGVVQS